MNSKQKPLEAGYTAEFDTVDEYEWYKIINQFSDANIYQTWSYDAIRCGEDNISHLILRMEDKIVAVAQARIVSLSLLGLGAAYIRWGPLWQLNNQEADLAVFRSALRALRNEYVCRRGLILRIFPILCDDNSTLYLDILREEGYTDAPDKDRGRTLILDISPPIEELRKRLDQKWRNCLNKAERNNLEVIQGTEDFMFEDFIRLYQELLSRKRFKEPNDINEFRKIQHKLPSGFKMAIFLCHSNGASTAGAICTAIGQTGVYLFGATNARGMKDKGSYLLQWTAIQWMKRNGCLYYNLNGINPSSNLGSYHFKNGLSGKNGKDVNYLGRFDCYSGMVNAILTRIAELILPYIKKARSLTRLCTRFTSCKP